MKQQVNLLDPELLPKKEAFHSSLILLAPVVMMAVLLAFYGYSRWELSQLRSNLTLLTQQEETLLNQLEVTVVKFPRKEKDPQLERDIQALNDEKNLKLRVLETLKGRTMTHTQGFADYLETIAGRWVDGLWMKRLVIDGASNDLRITGYAVDAELPPALLASFGEAPLFSGTAFRTFRLTQPGQRRGPLKFELDTRRVEPQLEEIEQALSPMQKAAMAMGGDPNALANPGAMGVPGLPEMPIPVTFKGAGK